MSKMTNRELRILMERDYRFIGIPQKKQSQIINILTYCKEIRDTSYPMKNSKVTELTIVEFTARKEKDLISINGSLSLTDGDRNENRSFEAYIMESDKEMRVYMDITRLCVADEPKIIRTSESMVLGDPNIITVTKYSQTDRSEEKIFSSEFPKKDEDDPTILLASLKQLHI